jgi:hypothetical protein
VVAVSSRPSQNNRHGHAEGLSGGDSVPQPSDISNGAGLRPISVEPDRRLREEAVHDLTDGVQARPWYQVLDEFRDWYAGYQNAHIEFEGPDGEIGRTALENSYMPSYGKRYYAKLKDFERGLTRRWDDVTTVMLTFTASHENAEGHPRCPADHMRDIAEGYGTARKLAHKVLSGRNWEYARVWEPHADGYGHLHVAVFVEGDAEPDEFRRVMRSYVENVDSAGWEAHRNHPCEEHAGEAATPWKSAESSCDECDVAVSVNDDVENVGSYVSEYIGIFGDEVLERPVSEQAFYAIAWATNTRRVDFSNGAQEIITDEQFRRETGLNPEDRGDSDADDWGASDGSDGWEVRSICSVPEATGRPVYSDPTTGGVRTASIEGRPGMDPPKRVS